MMIRPILLTLLLFIAACYRVPDRIDPRVSYQLQDQHFQQLTGAFPPLSKEERGLDWGKEAVIARAFAEELDLYRAVSTFKRALILIEDSPSRKLELQYDILLCFFLAKRYDEVIEAFEKSDLAHVDKSFYAYHDLLLILYESYRETDHQEKQAKVLELMEKSFPVTNEELKVSRAIREGNLVAINEIACGFQHPSYLDNLMDCYSEHKKSVATAQCLNAFLPGAGYLYIGQRKSAMTAFLLNGLFIAAATQFFLHKHVAAGIITAGFEAGWYFGGIYGAGEEAKYYNERLYERAASGVLNEHKLFPVLMLDHAF
ncbi:MAG: tetratricopeptide repeat protein [Verrucomicrobia bacterium]|nr:tetratricopeptide repeat protein [Verrucomicrobiota bacterium]MDE3047610.1 tetratricopeptide repeat protein [Verrucomicrobiota bacterium]